MDQRVVGIEFARSLVRAGSNYTFDETSAPNHTVQKIRGYEGTSS